MPEVPVALIVNTYERTYRDVLRPGFFPGIAAQNKVTFAERFALVNNVSDPDDARTRATALVEAGEITGFAFVADSIDAALRVTRVPRHALRDRGYFLDYGLVMSITGTSEYVLGWDAETVLPTPAHWVAEAIALLESDRSVFSASPRWPMARDTLEAESFASRGPWSLNYGFSDQVFLVRRTDIAAPIYRSFAPASWARHAQHPGTFEGRVEAYQRAAGGSRASHSVVSYETNDLQDVIERAGGYTTRELLRRKAGSLTRRVLYRAHLSAPRFRLP